MKTQKQWSGIKCKFCNKKMRSDWHWENHSCPGRILDSISQAKAALKSLKENKNAQV